MSTKKDRLFFVKEVKDICTEQGLKPKACDWGVEQYENDKLTVTIRPEEDHKYLYSVFVQFKIPCSKGNPFSGKHNFHSIERVKIAVADFEDHLIDVLCIS